MAATLEKYQNDLIEMSMSANALKFGSFTLKSGRQSPYFFNAGLLSTGPIMATIADAYAATIVKGLASETKPIPNFDVLFGPAYKGIPFAAAASIILHSQHGVDVGFAYDRKEVKDHGEGGQMVGADVKGKKVLILDDVMTSGKAVRGAINMVQAAGGQVVGVVQMLNREEIGQDGGSTVTEVEGLIGGGPVSSILRMRDLMEWLQSKGMERELESMKEYWNKYGLKDQI